MTCETFDELLAALALSTLEPEETREARRHVSTCRRHDEALAVYGAIARRLPLAAEERQPSPQLRSRVLGALEVERRSPVEEESDSGRRGNVLLSLFRRTVFAYATAAVLLVAVVGLLGWNLALQNRDSGDGQTVHATLSGAGGTGELVYSRKNHLGVLQLDLPLPLPGRTYQAWQITPAGPASLGLMSVSGPNAFSADLSGATAVAISEEPAGGSPQPTGDPLVVAQLP